MPCPSFERLLEYADGRLPADESATLERHLATACDDCRATLTWYEGFVETARSDDSVEPAPWVLRKAIDAFADAKAAAARRGVRGIVARIRAALVFDSFGGATDDAVPARSAHVASRQLLYSAVPYDVDLFVAEGSSRRSLAVSGQVLPVDGDDFESVRGLTVTIEREGEPMASVETSELGEFAVDGIAPGVYDVRLANDDREIVIWHTPLSLG